MTDGLNDLNDRAAPTGTCPVGLCKSMPFSIREKVEDELFNIVKQNIISPISHSNWDSPKCYKMYSQLIYRERS